MISFEIVMKFLILRSQTNIQKETKTIVGDDSNETTNCRCCPQHQYLLATIHQLQGNDIFFFDHETQHTSIQAQTQNCCEERERERERERARERSSFLF
jgi:hypothetical protein